MPKHKYSNIMSQKSHVEPIGVFMLDPSCNHGLNNYCILWH